jgi:hypothetical protein
MLLIPAAVLERDSGACVLVVRGLDCDRDVLYVDVGARAERDLPIIQR